MYGKIDPQKREHGFEIFGLDFMIDKNFKVWLIEINTNPCLETSSPILRNVVSQLLDHSFKICIDPLFPPPWPMKKFGRYNTMNNYWRDNLYTLIFDETEDCAELQGYLKFTRKKKKHPSEK